MKYNKLQNDVGYHFKAQTLLFNQTAIYHER